MRTKKTIIAALSFVALLCASERAAHACSCLAPGPPREEAERARAVFAGEVVEVIAPAGEGAEKKSDKGEADCARESEWQSAGSGRDEVRVRFKVKLAWKNVTSGEVVVTTPASSAACGYSFRKGEAYVVYAYGGDEGRELSTGLCSRTRPLSAADEDLRELGAGVPVTSSVFVSIGAAASAKPTPTKPRRRTRRAPRRRRSN
ncbi:MAG TPA: hypothetical protein VFX96_03030 [Pyrinomonadaceae bacterium]|nr:hypothetical protein [Pyrinomonadaceae bacterium]